MILSLPSLNAEIVSLVASDNSAIMLFITPSHGHETLVRYIINKNTLSLKSFYQKVFILIRIIHLIN